MICDPDIDQEHAPHADISRLLVTSLALLWILVCGMLWNLQPWQRPSVMRQLDEGIWLVLFVVGLLALVAILRPWLSLARFASTAVLVSLAGALLLGGLHVVCENMAIANLKSRVGDEIAWYEKQLSHGLHAPRDTLASKFKDWLEKIGVGSPGWLDAYVRKQSASPVQATHGLVAMSDWRIRRKFADALLRDEFTADYLMSYWKEYFPAITGQDVTLACRRRWLDDLDGLRKESGHALSTRQAALLMMALIILTDPPEFESWRVPVRDAMIRLQKPLRDRWIGHDQMFWHRSLDALLALDPPDSWARLTRPMVVEGESLRQAAEAPVRGLFGNFDVFLTISEVDSDPRNLFLYWQCAGSALDEYPEGFDEENAQRIRNWRRDILFRWLMALGDGSRDDLAQINPPVLDMLDRWPAPTMTDSQQEQLAVAASTLADGIRQYADLSMEIDSAKITRLRHILPRLQGKHADAAFERIIPVLLQPDRYAGKTTRGFTFGKEWAECLWLGMRRMTEEQQLLLQQRLRPLMQNLTVAFPYFRSVLCMDAWSKHPALSSEQWLLMAWAWERPWHSVPRKESPDILPLQDVAIPSVPEFSKEEIDAFVRHVVLAMQPQKGTSLTQLMSERFGVFMAIEPNKAYLLNRLQARLRQRGIHSGMPADVLEREVKADFAEMGLCRIDASMAETIRERARMQRLFTGSCLHLPELAAPLWNDVLKDPARAAQAAIDGFGGDNSGVALNSLVLAIEHSPSSDEVILAIWEVLRTRCHDREQGRQAYGALFRLARFVSEAERSAMRRDYLAARPGWQVQEDRNGWSYETTVSTYVSLSRASPIMGMRDDSYALYYAGGGMGIPWGDDELSARYSWETMFQRQCYNQPILATSPYRRELFAYLAVPCDEGIMTGSHPLRMPIQRLVAPFPPTPWQKARELYRKRPDLKFP